MGQVLIDEKLVFDEDNFLLFRVDYADEEPLRLGAIASRCLALLLRSSGVVVRKRELMDEAWGQYGLEVTDNSLAQVIRQLRLALEKLQPDHEFIQTLPRIGYKLSDSVRVQELPAVAKKAPAPALTDNELPIPDAAPLSTVADSSGECVEPLANVVATTSPTRLSMPPIRWGLGLALPLWGILAFLLGKFWLAPAPEVSPPIFAAPVTMNEVQVYPPAQDPQLMTSSYLQPMILRSRKLAVLEGLSLENLHLYLLPGRRGGDQILCDGELKAPGSRCIGVQQHE